MAKPPPAPSLVARTETNGPPGTRIGVPMLGGPSREEHWALRLRGENRPKPVALQPMMPEATTVQRVVTHGGIRLHCVHMGPSDGPLVLFLHGFPARWSTWRAVMPAFAARGFLAVAPDLRGYGASDRPKGVDSYSIRKIVEDVVAIVRAFDRDKAFIVGHDFGGGVAWATAMIHPELVARLAILNAVHPVGFARQMRKWSQVSKSWYVFFFLLPFLPEWWLARNDLRFLKRSLANDGLSPDVIDDLLEGVRPAGALHAAIDWYRASVRDGVRKRVALKKVDVPTLIVWGDRDRYLDPELATPPSDWVSNVRIEHVENASHWVHHDAPARVADVVLSHLVS